jgi:phosphoribosylaminoimidazole carboxylase (NCAIR synthetase)
VFPVPLLPDTLAAGTRAALTGSASARLVLLGNFEVESDWAVGETGLPRLAMAESQAVVNRMDEFTLLLGGGGDHVVLKQAPDPEYLSYLAELGVDLPAVLTPARQDPLRTVTRDALEDAALLARLRELAAAGRVLWPHGVSPAEERLARLTGLPLVTAGADVCKRVNSTIYSRRVARELGLPQPAGRTCEDVAELGTALRWARTWLGPDRPAVVKDAYGVSGKGIVVLRDGAAADRVQRMVERNAARSGDRRLALVVEEWVPKQADLNYQFTVAVDGSVHFDFVRRAITERGVHLGHRIPAGLTPAQDAAVQEAAQALGGWLARDGYLGVAGVDALVDGTGAVLPVIEINARNNMSTYQERLREAFIGPDRAAVAGHYPVRLRAPMPFGRLRDLLGELLLAPGRPDGLLVNNVATLNAGAYRGGPFEGRLYGIAVAGTPDAAAALDRAVRTRLAAVDEEPSDE